MNAMTGSYLDRVGVQIADGECYDRFRFRERSVFKSPTVNAMTGSGLERDRVGVQIVDGECYDKFRSRERSVFKSPTVNVTTGSGSGSERGRCSNRRR
ncbi:hypothetical protein Q3G72_000068 [Acer saccharum]|nr:hypothetical protein Q3G72_000068 [Acer saccharum]